MQIDVQAILECRSVKNMTVRRFPIPGIIVIGKLYAGMEAFNAPAAILVLCGLVAFAASQAHSRLQYA